MTKQTVNGIAVKGTRIYLEGAYWRWQITDINGKQYVDGGNYQTREQAQDGLKAALDK
jgi:hypothetical protein